VPSTNKKRTLSIEARRWRIGGLEEELIFEMEEGIWWAVAEFRLFVACRMDLASGNGCAQRRHAGTLQQWEPMEICGRGPGPGPAPAGM